MALEFYIVGGRITIPKDIFVKEMLGGDSILRNLLKWHGTGSFKEKHPMLVENQEEGLVAIDFTGIDSVKLGDDPKELLSKLKQRYKEKVKGWVAINGTYDLMNGMFHLKIDLNSEGDKVEYMQ